MAHSKSDKKNLILQVIKAEPGLSSKEIHDRLAIPVGYATVKRLLQDLLETNMIETTGNRKATRYQLSRNYELHFPTDVDAYFEKEIDERTIKAGYNQVLVTDTLDKVPVFTKDELDFLEVLQQQYRNNVAALSPLEFKKEMDRLAIDLSWKSSQIEGNTYSLLETEKLLQDKKTAAGKTKDEAVMLLNHKEALDFIIAHPSYVNPLTVSGIEDIHSILIRDLGVDRNIRKRRVGISGTNYKPLDNEFQIREALEDMCTLINKQENVFVKAFLALVLTSYIQPFADGNKRTARIISNAILMNHHCCPLSFRTIDPIEYKKAMLIFYEQNNIHAFKKIFMSQFEFAVKTYF